MFLSPIELTTMLLAVALGCIGLGYGFGCQHGVEQGRLHMRKEMLGVFTKLRDNAQSRIIESKADKLIALTTAKLMDRLHDWLSNIK